MTESPDDRTITCNDLEQFVATLRQRELGLVILAWQKEYSQDVDAPGVVYDRLQNTTCLAYQRSTGQVIRCELEGDAAAIAPLTAHLSALGFRVEERCRNLG